MIKHSPKTNDLTNNTPKEIKTPKQIVEICQTVREAGGQALIVGGWVRDQLLGKDSKDIDLEIFGLRKSELESALKNFGLAKEVGKSFGVYKIGESDVALARMETKTGSKHTDFEIETDPNFTPKQTSRRRDFTVNALMYDPLEQKVLDFHQGLADLRSKTLRMVDKNTFIEDPLRVYRLASLASRLGFKVEPATQKTCRQMTPELKHLAKERISEEWRKMLLDSPAPSVGLKILEKIGVIRQYYPELEAMIDTPQEPLWHPEGDVWTHTLIALDYSAGRVKKDRLTIMLAVLLHDIGKPQTTQQENGRIRSHGHETRPVAGPLIRQFLRRLIFSGCDNRLLTQKVENLVVEHMTPYQLSKNLKRNQTIDKALRRLSVRLKPAVIAQLLELAETDYFATQGKKENKEPLDRQEILRQARELEITQSQPRPFLTGKDLIELGREPGPIFGEILKMAYEKQLDGKIKNQQEALQWLKSYLQS